jgi:hypothetical protein
MAKIMKTTFNFHAILYNRALLYFFLIISVLDLFYFSNAGDVRSIFIFVMIGFLTSFFSKNMIVILVIALVSTHLLKFGIKATINEGYTSKPTKEGITSEDETPEPDATEEDTKEETNGISQETMTDLNEFKEVQTTILDNLKKMEPLIERAEGFIEKYGANILEQPAKK